MTTVFDGARATVRHLRKSKVVVLSGAEQGREVEIGKPRVTCGRSIINDLVLSDKAISGSHFEILARDDGYRLRDLDSTNGTFVGDLRIREVWLKPGQEFRVGHTQLRFVPTQDIVEIPLSKRDTFESVTGSSVKMREIFATLEKVAPSELTVLVTGETGTGKEMIARGIHQHSPRKSKPFVVLDCGAIPKDLIESTLFGHEKGSFTGAVGAAPGLLRAGARRHHLPRRDRRAGHQPAAEALARAGEPRAQARRRRPRHQDRRARGGGDQPRSAHDGEPVDLPRRSLLPPLGHPRRAAAAARAQGGHPGAGRDVPARDRRAAQPADDLRLRRAAVAAVAQLAGQRARAEERGRACGVADRGVAGAALGSDVQPRSGRAAHVVVEHVVLVGERRRRRRRRCWRCRR